MNNDANLALLWTDIVNYLEKEKIINNDVVFNYLRGGVIINSDYNGQLVLLCDMFMTKILVNQFALDIEEAAFKVTGNLYKIMAYEKDELKPNIIQEDTSSINTVKNEFIKQKIDRNLNFENFVMGRSNAQALNAALTISLNPGEMFNPLFIYGNPGLGKTHLLNAIGSRLCDTNPNFKIGFIAGLDFVNGVVESSKNRQVDNFKKAFSDLDVLLIDDIQYIAGKDKTHEVFFSIFNELVNNKKQICLTSDRLPKDIKGLEDRIISRFNQGLNVNIEAPEYETSVAILKQKLNQSGISDVDDEVISYIATNFSQDVRSLEGALKRLLFYAIDFSKCEKIDLKIAVEAFRDQLGDTSDNEISINLIKKATCDYYGINKQQIISKNRTKNIAMPRQIAMYLCRKLIDIPYKDIGKNFGGRDHSTVINACEKIEKEIRKDTAYEMAVKAIEDIVKKSTKR